MGKGWRVRSFLARMASPALWVFLGALGLYTLTGGFYSNFISDGDVMYATTYHLSVYHELNVDPNPGLPKSCKGRTANGTANTASASL